MEGEDDHALAPTSNSETDICCRIERKVAQNVAKVN